MPRTHETLSGHSVEYPDPDPKLEKFLKRVRALVDDRKSTEDDVVTLIYGRENPILDQTLFPERGAVTREVLDNPVYSVLTDLLARKQAAEKGLDTKQLGKRYTLTVAEAAAAAEVTPDAIRKAIGAKRLPSWKREGEYYIDPKTLAAVTFGSRKPVEPLRIFVGYLPDASLLIRHTGGQLPDGGSPGTTMETTLPKWRRVAVLTAGHNRLRMWVLEPGPVEDEVEFHGLFVRGRFRVAEKINDSKAARLAWEGFKAS